MKIKKGIYRQRGGKYRQKGYIYKNNGALYAGEGEEQNQESLIQKVIPSLQRSRFEIVNVWKNSLIIVETSTLNPLTLWYTNKVIKKIVN